MTPEHFEEDGIAYLFAPAPMKRRLWYLTKMFPGKQVMVVPQEFSEPVWQIHKVLDGIPVEDL